MAKTYLEIHPAAKILVVDRAQSVGGSWASERLYPGLKTNNIIGSYEFSDFPMTPERYGAKRGGYIPGSVVHQYFSDSAVQYGIDSCLLLSTDVKSATLRDDGKWQVEVRTTSQDQTISSRSLIIVADKMVVASGLTSEPNIPTFQGQEEFKGLLIHSKQLKERAADLRASKNVVVLGGNKSAWDVCYDAARSGSRVHMVSRPTGGGPSYVWPRSFSFGLWKLSLAKMAATRFFMGFDPTFYGKSSPLPWWSRFLHQTSLGNKPLHWFWRRLDRQIKAINGYGSHPELKKLEPWTTPFWMGNSLSIHNYETSWFDLVREGKITFHVSEIVSLSSNKVNLSNGESLQADTLVCCTGWKHKSSIQFLPAEVSDLQPEESKQMVLDIAKAETDIASQLKYLKHLPRRTSNGPALKSQPAELLSSSDPSNLYRFMVPWQRRYLASKSLAFIGVHSSIHVFVVAQAQALWISAFFDGRLKHLSPAKVDYDAVRYNSILQAVYGAVRRPRECGGAAGKHPDLVFDSYPYVDCLLRDLDLSTSRKGGFWEEVFQPYGPADYKGLVEEWKAANAVEGTEITADIGKEPVVFVSPR